MASVTILMGFETQLEMVYNENGVSVYTKHLDLCRVVKL